MTSSEKHSPSSKIFELEELSKVLSDQGEKTIALVTGCFDVVHHGHIDFFRFAKAQADLLVVGVDNDQNVRQNKGSTRPMFTLAERMKVLSELASITYIFPITAQVTFSSEAADIMLTDILRALQPTFLVVNPLADKSWQRKQELCRKLGVELKLDQQGKPTSSSQIIETLF